MAEEPKAVGSAATAQSNPSQVERPKSRTFEWKGYTWGIKAGKAMGPGPNTFGENNVFVDDKGLLHLKLTHVNGEWNCAEIYTKENLGFGTYQWQLDTKVDAFDPYVVLGLFPYGPEVLGPDGTNEIDIEFARWGDATKDNGWWTVYPNSGKTIGQKTFPLKQKTNQSTSRFTWKSDRIDYCMMEGLQTLDSTADAINTWSYAPADFKTLIPQNPMPLHFNLWLFRGHVPENGQEVEVVIRDFQKR